MFVDPLTDFFFTCPRRLEILGAEARKQVFGEKWNLKFSKIGLNWRQFGVKLEKMIPKISFSGGFVVFAS